MSVYGGVHPRNRLIGAIGIKQTVFMQEEVLMFPLTDKFDDIFQQFAIFLTALFAGGLLGILLQSPYGPKQYIRMFHLVNLVSCRLIIDEASNRFFRCLHHIFKLIHLVQRKCQSRQGYKHIAGTALEPRITGKDIMFSFLLVVELMC